MTPGARRERAAGLICATAMVIACADPGAPAPPETGPGPMAPTASARAAAVATKPGTRAAPIRAVVDDAAERLAAALEEPGSASSLRGTLRQLVQALSRSDRARSVRLLAEARRALGDAASPDLSAIGLALDAVERDLGS
jgi:hypothetical protein